MGVHDDLSGISVDGVEKLAIQRTIASEHWIRQH